MSTITWINTDPTQASDATDTDNAVRSTLTNFATGVGESMYWPGSADSQGASLLSAGLMKPGAGRLSRASERSATQHGDGYLSVSTKRNAVVHVGSTRSELVAHPMGYEWYRIPLTVSNGTLMGLLQMGSYTTDQNQGTALRTDFPLAFASADSVTVLLTSTNSNMLLAATAVNASGFSSAISELGAISTSHTVSWTALGTVTT